MANITIDVIENGTTTLATSGKYCDRNIDINVNVPSSGGGIEIDPIVLTGNQMYGGSSDVFKVFIETFPDKVSTRDIATINYMFSNSKITTIPFDINMQDLSSKTTNHGDCSSVFRACPNLTALPKINYLKPQSLSYFLYQAYMITEIPEGWTDNWDFSTLNTYAYANISNLIVACYSLRKVPKGFLKNFTTGGSTSSYNKVYQALVNLCYSLDEIEGIPVDPATITSNMMTSMCTGCGRIKRIVFETEDGTPKTAKWKGQTINLLNNGVGYLSSANNKSYVLNYNSGITADKEVEDDATYQALKNDPDWFTANKAYSRYNHDSAVETINSLPDTSAYLASAGGTNTIKFDATAGSLTDGGAINTLTEEEIAVAVNKGWTVSYA